MASVYIKLIALVNATEVRWWIHAESAVVMVPSASDACRQQLAISSLRLSKRKENAFMLEKASIAMATVWKKLTAPALVVVTLQWTYVAYAEVTDLLVLAVPIRRHAITPALCFGTTPPCVSSANQEKHAKTYVLVATTAKAYVEAQQSQINVAFVAGTTQRALDALKRMHATIMPAHPYRVVYAYTLAAFYSAVRATV